jgi:hypothetical protein
LEARKELCTPATGICAHWTTTAWVQVKDGRLWGERGGREVRQRWRTAERRGVQISKYNIIMGRGDEAEFNTDLGTRLKRSVKRWFCIFQSLENVP